MAGTGTLISRHSVRSSLWPEGLLFGAMAVMLLTPKALAAVLYFNTYSAQVAGFLVFGFVVTSRQPTPLQLFHPTPGTVIALGGRVASVILCAGALEAAQGLVQRSGRWFDLMINASAVTVGAAVAVARLALREYGVDTDDGCQTKQSERGFGVAAEPITSARRRFFIVSTGRSGSSLLAAILADAGAKFGLPVPARWDRQAGEMEHPQLTMAARRMMAAHAISREKPPGVRRWHWTLLRSFAKRRLRATLPDVHFVKVEGAHELVRPTFKLGYFPSVIISYRRFEDYAVSHGLIHANATIASLEHNYRSILRGGLWLLNTFGGCVVSYEQLADPEERDWAEPLSSVTGIAVERLIAARDARVEAPNPQVLVRDTERHAEAAFNAVDALRRRAVPPSPQAIRAWHARASAMSGRELS